ncbi:histone-lysine N-methyltransferase SETDB2 isoform X3 [Engystomops pustulosus]|uniref:histone-lysine N-methyltransferase SETDB2 isoform X3 n=1 Tax=Engystomops pustulosus TaxID=76066 RepID=UPI003AFA599A
MKRREKYADVTDPSTISTIQKIANVSIREAKTFWQNRRKEGNVDIVFKEVLSKLQLLCQKIKDGSATDQDHMRGLMLVNLSDLEDFETCQRDESFVEDQDAAPIKPEELLPIATSADIEEPLTNLEPESRDKSLPTVTSVVYEDHRCGQMCLSDVNRHFSRKQNPLKFPIICHFQRRHAKPSLISRHLDVIYKAPCGKNLRDYDDVCSYLFKTKCRFLFLDHFSFDTYLQLDRNLVKNKIIVQEADISGDAESVPVPFCNEIDNTRPAPFTYRKSPWPRGYSINNFTDLFQGSCDCTDGCLDVSKCACLQLTAKELDKDAKGTKRGNIPGYKHKRLPKSVPTGIYECNVSCKCDHKMCQNRVVQHGLQVRLQVFKTKGKGWGVRCLDDLDRGTFVCIYAGRILMKSMDVTVSVGSVEAAPAKMTPSICPTKIRYSSHSDSEIAASPSTISNITPLLRGSSRSDLKRKRLCKMKEGRLDSVCVKRPKTKTAILQKRKRQLIEEGTVTMMHSSDDELFTPPASPKVLLCGNTEDEAESIELIHTSVKKTLQDNEAGYVSDESSYSVTCSSKENSDPPDSSQAEHIYFLDSSTEGNIGRFLNLFTEPFCTACICGNSL